MDLKAAHINAVEISRKLKPSIPLVGIDNIPIKHEMEFEMILRQKVQDSIENRKGKGN